MTLILLCRHGHVEGLEPERFRGRAETVLTAQGFEEAKALAGEIAARFRPSAIYTSPLGRAVQTGAAIAAATGAAAVAIRELMDIDYGAWQWRAHEEVRAEAPELFETWFKAPQRMRFPGGESLQDIVLRGADALRRVRAEHPEDAVVIVGHDSLNRAVLLQLADQPLSAFWRFAQSPACLNVIDLSDAGVRIESLNETAHLRPGGRTPP
jgi:broad specificity phosphatase PhoE